MLDALLDLSVVGRREPEHLSNNARLSGVLGQYERVQGPILSYGRRVALLEGVLGPLRRGQGHQLPTGLLFYFSNNHIIPTSAIHLG